MGVEEVVRYCRDLCLSKARVKVTDRRGHSQIWDVGSRVDRVQMLEYIESYNTVYICVPSSYMNHACHNVYCSPMRNAKQNCPKSQHSFRCYLLGNMPSFSGSRQ